VIVGPRHHLRFAPQKAFGGSLGSGHCHRVFQTCMTRSHTRHVWWGLGCQLYNEGSEVTDCTDLAMIELCAWARTNNLFVPAVQAPLAPRKTLRLSDMPLLPSLANSCPPGFALGMATDSRDRSEAKDMPRLPPLRSMPFRGRDEEAWADLKPSRTHPLPPKRSSQDLAQEGLDTQLSRRSSNRAWSEMPKCAPTQSARDT
jgi:hypothetical protein